MEDSPPLVENWAEAGLVLAGWFLFVGTVLYAAFAADPNYLGAFLSPFLPVSAALALIGGYWGHVCRRVYGPPTGTRLDRARARRWQRNTLRLGYCRPLWGAIVFVLLHLRPDSASTA